MDNLSRRHLLFQIAVAALGTRSSGAIISKPTMGPKNKRALLLLGDRDSSVPYEHSRALRIAKNVPGFVNTYDPNNGSLQKIKIPLFPHSLTKLPNEASTVIAVEKWTGHAALVDLKKEKVTRELVPPGSTRFFGHASFNLAGDTCFLSGFNDSTSGAIVAAYDVRTWKLKEMLEVGRPGRDFNPHEISILNSNLGMVSVYRREQEKYQGAICFFSLKPFKVVDSWPLVELPSHFIRRDKFSFISIGAALNWGDLPNALVIENIDLENRQVFSLHRDPDFKKLNYTGETVSVRLPSKDWAIVTTYTCSSLVLWDLISNKFKIVEVGGEIKAIELLGDRLFASVAGKLIEYKITGKLQIEEVSRSVQIGNGSHFNLVYI